jgi:hypothetical protein
MSSASSSSSTVDPFASLLSSSSTAPAPTSTSSDPFATLGLSTGGQTSSSSAPSSDLFPF